MSSENRPTRFLLVDDHMIIRTGLKIVLREEYFASEVDEAENTSAAKNLLSARAYDLLILDINIPDDNIFDFVMYLQAVKPEQKILMFSTNNEELYATKFFKLGVKGYLSKQAPDSEIKNAVRTVMNGRIYLSEGMQHFMTSKYLTEDSNKPSNPFDQLTTREFEIVSLILKGESTKEIGNILNLQISTVSTHKTNIFNKLNVKNVLQLSELARLNGVEVC